MKTLRFESIWLKPLLLRPSWRPGNTSCQCRPPPEDRDFDDTSPRKGNSNSQGLGQQEHVSWNNSTSKSGGNQKTFLLRLDPKETASTCSEEHKTLHEEQQQWKTYLQQKQSFSHWPLSQKPKLATMEGNNKNCACRHSLKSSTPLKSIIFYCGHVGY